MRRLTRPGAIFLLDVFNEPDPERRSAAIAQTYAEDVVWHEPDRVNRGREALSVRAAELRAETPDWVFETGGPVSVTDDLGRLAFEFGPAGQPLVSGMDIAHCKPTDRIVQKVEAEPLAGPRWRPRPRPRIDAMTKDIRTGLMRIGVAAILFASSIYVFVAERVDTDQLVLQGILFVCAVGMLVQGVVGIVTARRR